MKKVLKILLIVIITFLIIWISALIKCEYLTHTYGEYHRDVIEKEYNIGDGYFKVLEHNGEYTRIYCIIDNEYNKLAIEMLITHHDNKITNERAIWTTRGTADDAIWPYWWDFFRDLNP